MKQMKYCTREEWQLLCRNHSQTGGCFSQQNEGGLTCKKFSKFCPRMKKYDKQQIE